MREFAYGSDAQYTALKKSLRDGQCHVYNCTFPPSFSAGSGRIGFEKDSISYILYIDKGLRHTGRGHKLLKDWLAAGSLRFLDFSDMRDFLRGLSALYSAPQGESEGGSDE